MPPRGASSKSGHRDDFFLFFLLAQGSDHTNILHSKKITQLDFCPITSLAHDGPICQDDNSATTRRQKKIRPAIESLAPPLSITCVEIAVSNADRSRILKVSYLLQIWCTYTSS